MSHENLLRSRGSVFAGVAAAVLLLLGNEGAHAAPKPVDAVVRYQYESVDGVRVFYREAGDPSRPALVLLHGFPASSHMYRHLLRELADEFYLVAPDYPGFGDSEVPSQTEYAYTFDGLASTIGRFLEQKGLSRYALMMHDYGAPVGYRIATRHPARVTGLVVMNGNAYEEGLDPESWGPLFEYWKNRTPELEAQITASVFSLEALRWQYTHGTRNPEAILPDNWNLDFMKNSRPGLHAIQLALFYDYQTNVRQYPKWQRYLREEQPPTLVVWGANDAYFPPAGAEAYKRDLPEVEIHLLDTGHFPLEEEGTFIATKVRGFLRKAR